MRAYIEKLKESGALIELEHSVSSRYEAASIGLKYKDKPVLFHAVDDIHRVIMNAVCSREMLADLLGTTLIILHRSSLDYRRAVKVVKCG